MIDMEKARKAYKDYAKKFDANNKRMCVKIEHMERVSKISKEIAKRIELDEENIKLAELIGLLHDIGRFEQIKRFNTFSDNNSINHGQLGAEILFKEGLIRNFIDDDSYDNIIEKAILSHNRLKLIEGLNEQESIHAKIIRDADKTDIFYVLCTSDVETNYESNNIEKEKITDDVFESFINNKSINYSQMKTHADLTIAHFAYIYDFNYKYGLEVIKENNYLDKLYKLIKFEDEKTQKEYTEVYKMARDYLDNMILAKV